MKVPVALLAVLLLAPAPVRAQAITAYTLRIYAQGASQPTTTAVLQATDFVCNQATVPAPTGTILNPNKIALTDPDHAGKDCLYTDAGAGPLLAIPWSGTTYTATLAATNSAGTGPESAASNPFGRPGTAPPAPAAPRVFKG